MDPNNVFDSHDLTVEQIARIKALECASKMMAEFVNANTDSYELRFAREKALCIAVTFYEWIMNG